MKDTQIKRGAYLRDEYGKTLFVSKGHDDLDEAIHNVECYIGESGMSMEYDYVFNEYHIGTFGYRIKTKQ